MLTVLQNYKNKPVLLIVFLGIFYFTKESSGSETKNTVKLAAIDWCPQICIDEDEPGYVVEIVNEVFNSVDAEITIEHYPWSRAIKRVTNGQNVALLSPAKKEAPNLVYPLEPVGYQRMCFFVLNESSWQYLGPQSLVEESIGIALDTSIEELNNYIKSFPKQFYFQPYHERFIKQNAGMVKKGRLTSFIFTLNSTWYELERLNLHVEFKNAGCVSRAPIYIAFSPEKNSKDEVQKLIHLWDREIVNLRLSGRLDEIIKKYSIE